MLPKVPLYYTKFTTWFLNMGMTPPPVWTIFKKLHLSLLMATLTIQFFSYIFLFSALSTVVYSLRFWTLEPERPLCSYLFVVCLQLIQLVNILVRYLQNLGADLLGIGYFLLWKESNTIVNQDIRDRPYIAKWYIRDKCVNIDPQ